MSKAHEKPLSIVGPQCGKFASHLPLGQLDPWINSLWPSDTLWHQTSWSTLVQVMSSAEPMLTYWQLDPQEHGSVKFGSKYKHFREQNIFDNVVCKMIGILFRSQCVNVQLKIAILYTILPMRLWNFVSGMTEIPDRQSDRHMEGSGVDFTMIFPPLFKFNGNLILVWLHCRVWYFYKILDMPWQHSCHVQNVTPITSL